MDRWTKKPVFGWLSIWDWTRKMKKREKRNIIENIYIYIEFEKEQMVSWQRKWH